MNSLILQKKYKINQNVRLGPRYTEHHYPAFNSNFIGRWQRYGGKVDVNASVQPILCDECRSDFFRRQKNRESSQIPPRSYQVEGITYPLDKWEWEFCICRNRYSCWGQSERLFDVKRKRDKYQMTQVKVLGGIHEQIEDRHYFELTQTSNYPNRFQGTINRSRRPSFFWPNLFDGQPENDWYIFHVDNQTNLPLPEHMRGSPFCTLPEVYKKPEYKYVNNFTFEIFRRNEDYPFPTKLWESKQNHHPVGITTLDLYPGHVSSIRISNATHPTESMESAQQLLYFTGRFLLKLAGHVTKVSKNSNWLIIFVLLSATRPTVLHCQAPYTRL